MFPLYILTAGLLTCTLSCNAIASNYSMQCPACGSTIVPYPLSTQPNCGDQGYKIRCDAGTLRLDALNGSSYTIKSIDPDNQKIIIRTPDFTTKNTCISRDLHPSYGLLLNKSLPFNITPSNTFMFFNCTKDMLQSTLDCSKERTNPCRAYLKDNPLAAACKAISPAVCCWFRPGGFTTAYRIRLREDQCSAYQSYINLKQSLPVNKWPEPGVEIVWAMPQEPLCNSRADCTRLPESSCLPDRSKIKGQKRCYCNDKYHWDPYMGVCTKHPKCQDRSCKLRKRRAAHIRGFSLAAAAALLGIIIVIALRYRGKKFQSEAKKALQKAREDIINASNKNGKTAKVYTGKEITKATKNFSPENLLGAGGFGEVFKATFDDGNTAAIKRAKVGNIKGVDQILNEVRILCQVNHRHLVRILGCCVELADPVLVYEYISNGTLYDHLHGAYPSKWAPLEWKSRLKIAHQTAEALAYLHFSAVLPIYHRDIKSSNILLDNNFNAKVSDFGLSRLGITTDETHITTCAQGTLGYLDPEYYLNFQLTDKSDVYSFGVVLLELLTSKTAIDFNREGEEVNLVMYMKKMLREERVVDAVDNDLRQDATKLEMDSMTAFAYLAGACLEENRHNRPSMREVADEIDYIINIIKAVES